MDGPEVDGMGLKGSEVDGAELEGPEVDGAKTWQDHFFSFRAV